jgi:hypothetical protein
MDTSMDKFHNRSPFSFSLTCEQSCGRFRRYEGMKANVNGEACE